MSDSLSIEIDSRLVPVKDTEWRRLFPDSPDPVELIHLIEKSGFDGFVFHSLTVRQDSNPILVLPLFETEYCLTNAFNGTAKKMAGLLNRLCPNLLRIHVLGVGMVEGEWGELGIDTTVDPSVLREAWTMALTALDSLAEGLDASLLVWVNFTSISGKMIPMDMMSKYSSIPSTPCQVLPVRYDDLESYLNSLSKAHRKNMRRKLKASKAVTILRTVDPEPWLDAIQALYLQTFQSAEFSFGKHRNLFFEQVTKVVPGAEYVLYLLGEKLVAFNLLIRREQLLVDKYFCMEPNIGRDHNLYFLSWIENIRYCINHKIPLYHTGSGAEAVKAHLNASSIPSEILFKHRSPLIQKVLSSLGAGDAYAPKIEPLRANIGGELP